MTLKEEFEDIYYDSYSDATQTKTKDEIFDDCWSWIEQKLSEKDKDISSLMWRARQKAIDDCCERIDGVFMREKGSASNSMVNLLNRLIEEVKQLKEKK